MKKFYKIKTFIINLEHRKDRRLHILQEFDHRSEFDVFFVSAQTHSVGAVGLWRTVTGIIEQLIDDEDEYIVICEDDHQFTGNYSRELLLESISEARKLGDTFSVDR